MRKRNNRKIPLNLDNESFTRLTKLGELTDSERKKYIKTYYDKKEISVLINHLKNGDYLAPDFQRSYVWKTKDIVPLLNSVFRENPIGYFVFWKPNYEYVSRNKNNFLGVLNPSNEKKYIYVIDGQQRLTTLSHVITPNRNDDNEEIYDMLDKIVFDLYDFEFKEIRNSKDNLNYIPLSIIFPDTNNHQKRDEIIISNLKNHFGIDEIHQQDVYIKTIVNIRNNFKKTVVGTIDLNKCNLSEVIYIFDKINTQGRKLTVFDIVKTKWINSNVKIEEELLKLYENAKKIGFKFKKVDDLYNLFIDCLYLNYDFINDKGKNIDNIISSEDKLIYQITDKSIEIYKEFINNNIMIDAFNFFKETFITNEIKFSNIFKWVSLYFFKKSKNDYKDIRLKGDERNVLLKYINLLLLNDAYSSKTSSQLAKDIKFVNWLLETKDFNFEKFLYDNKIFFNYKCFSKEIIQKTYYENRKKSRAFLIENFLMNSAKDFITGSPIKNNIKEKFNIHHIFPTECKKINDISDRFIKSLSSSFANLSIITEKTNKIISKKNPSVYYEDIKKEMLINSSELDDLLSFSYINSNHLKKDNFEDFIEERTNTLVRELNSYYKLNDN